MSKPRFVISSPFDSYSGYGAHSRDKIKAIIELNKYEVQLLPQKWGETSWGFCKDHPEWTFLLDYIVPQDWQKTQPEIWAQITIPNEFQAVGKYNIGITAGIESTACKPEWVEGLNRMDMNWVSSKFAKDTFERMTYERKDQRTGQVTGVVKLEKPIEVIFEGANLSTYKPIKQSEIKTIDLKDIKEEFCYLFVGHWMQGELGHDRKNVGVLIKSFYDAFRHKVGKKPALILKASSGVASYISRDTILDKIKTIRDDYGDAKLPNIYLLNGEFDDSEINELYNHSKVKAMVSFTKGEGFGRPLLEFGLTGKPIIASGWSGHIDFLHPEYNVLLSGKLENVHQSAANNWLIPESQWFQVNSKQGISALKEVYKNYKQYLQRSKKQRHHVKTNFSWEKMKELVGSILDKNIPEFPKQVELKLPKLQLPKLKKIE
jgi:glycosyltransferase involved in cell wall biosynthesis|tara:strand:- start:670 stop:1965 length:1296 start_codon:yes stop_codon:yes gene_type:complete